MRTSKEKPVYQKPNIGTVEELSAELLVANQKLDEANQKLRRSEAQRTEMLANISHDLRSPAAAMRSAVDCLMAEEGLAGSEYQSILEIMDRRTAALEHLINELYFLVSLELPGFELAFSCLDVTAFLQEYVVIQKLNAKFAERELLFEADCEKEIPAELDTGRMVRVLDNLYENALRFSAKGDSIALGCRAVGDEVEIYVRDTGIGIAPDMLQAVFERTKTLSGSRTPGQGSGLGLSIVKTIVEKHRGRVWCESEPGRESTFFIRLPAAFSASG